MRKRYNDRKNVAKSERKKRIFAVVVLGVVIFYALFVPPLAHNVLSGNPSSGSYFDDLLSYWGIVSKNKCELNCDTNHDGICDLNCDTNNDGVCDRNCDTSHNGKCDLNCDDNGDGTCDRNCDTNGDGTCDRNCDSNGDGKCNLNCDDNGDGTCDRNCDTNGDGICDSNCYNNGTCTRNCDTNGDGVCDRNCDDNGDGVCDRNCDKNDNSNEEPSNPQKPSTDTPWNVGFTNAKVKTTFGDAREVTPVKFTATNAVFDVVLNGANDAITYEFTIKNSGVLNAKVDSIMISPANEASDIIHFDVQGIKVGDKLRAGDSTTMTVTTYYNENGVLNRFTQFQKTATIVINYAQD